MPAILALTAWGERWARPAEGSPMIFIHETCGQPFEAKVCCSACGGRIEAGAVRVLPGPGGAAKPGTMVLARRLHERAEADNDKKIEGEGTA